MTRERQVSKELVWSVWEFVTKHPQATYKTIAKACGIGTASVCQAMKCLNDLGYVTFKPRSIGARKVIIGAALCDVQWLDNKYTQWKGGDTK